MCIEHGVYAILDEVYEHLVFPGSKHVTMRSLPGMKDRCIRIGSAGKTFSFTDFKVNSALYINILINCSISRIQERSFLLLVN